MRQQSLLRAIRNGQRWMEMLINGEAKNITDLAAGEILPLFLRLRTACRGGYGKVRISGKEQLNNPCEAVL